MMLNVYMYDVHVSGEGTFSETKRKRNIVCRCAIWLHRYKYLMHSQVACKSIVNAEFYLQEVVISLSASNVIRWIFSRIQISEVNN